MSGAKLGYDFTALPRRRHPAWMGLAHGVGQFLYAPLFEINGGNPIPFHGGDWRVWLCRTWSLAGKARAPVCKSLDELAERGVIAIGAGVISVLFQPDSVHSEEVSRHNSATQRPTEDIQQPLSGSQTPQLSPNAGRHLDLSVGNNSEPKIQIDREKDRKREREEPAPVQNFRKPVGEPPPGFVDTYREDEKPKELSLADRVSCAWKDAVGVKLGKTPGSTKRVADSAAEIAEWLVQNPTDGLEPLAAFQAALKLYVADEKLRDKAWPLNWLLDRMPGYLAAKQPEQQTVSNPTHQEWVPPDYEAGNREAEARADREREEWFEQHPEYRAAYEADQRRMLEEYAESRKVVRIEDAPKPPKRAAPMTEAQRQERIRFLKQQAEQIRAATAAQ